MQDRTNLTKSYQKTRTAVFASVGLFVENWRLGPYGQVREGGKIRSFSPGLTDIGIL